MGNLHKTNKKARKRPAYEKDVTAEKDKLFFTICTLFAGNHADKIIIIIKVWGGLGSNSTEPEPQFFLLQILRAQPASSVRLSSPLSHMGVRSQSSSFFQPSPTLRSRVCGTRGQRSSRVSATKARDTPTRQHCSATLGEKGWSPSLYLACSQWQRLRRTHH